MKNEEKLRDTLWYILVAMFLLTACLMLGSCGPTRYVTYREKVTDTLYQSKIIHDSVDNYLHDSVWIQIKGDTVIQFKYRCKYMYKYLDRHDTLYQTKTDTVYQSVVKEKEKTITEKVIYELGKFALLVIIGIIIYLILRRLIS